MMQDSVLSPLPDLNTTWRDRRATSYGIAGGLIAFVGSLVLGVILERWHAATYGVTPDLRLNGWMDGSPWLDPLIAFLAGMLLIGASVGGLVHRVRSRIAGGGGLLWLALLIIGGVLLVMDGLPAALDLTVAPPQRVTGDVQYAGGSTGIPFRSYSLAVSGRSLEVTREQYLEYNRECVVVVYGTHSHIAFSVGPVGFNNQQDVCGDFTS